MTIQSIEAELRRSERRSEKLRKQLEDRKRKQFTSIPAKYGFKSMDTFIAALTPYVSPRPKSKIGGGDTSTGSRPAAKATKAKTTRRSHTRYSDQVKGAVRAALKKGDQTVRDIAKKTGVSEYAIIDWKKAWGFVKHRKAKRKAAKKK